MMKQLLKLCSAIILLTACDDYSTYTVDGDRITIEPVNYQLDSEKVMKWEVNPNRSQLVSKGFQFKVALPLLEESLILKLLQERGIDSWLIRVKKRAFQGSEILGYVYIPLVLPGQQGALRIKQLEYGYINVFYAAAAHSKRFESFPCPSFGHQTLLNDLNVGKSGATLSKIIINGAEEEKIISKVEQFGYTPTTFNGGMELKGTYSVEIALYRSDKGQKMSSYLEYPQEIEASGESQVAISGCDNYEIPENTIDDKLLEKFKWSND